MQSIIAIVAVISFAVANLCDDKNAFQSACSVVPGKEDVVTCHVNNANKLPCGIPSSTTSLTLVGDIRPENEHAEKILSRSYFSNLANLVKLVITGNLISVLPDEVFADLTKLQILNIAGNQIWSISPTAFPANLEAHGYRCGTGYGAICPVNLCRNSCGAQSACLPSDGDSDRDIDDWSDSDYLWIKSQFFCLCKDGYSYSKADGCIKLPTNLHAYYPLDDDTCDVTVNDIDYEPVIGFNDVKFEADPQKNWGSSATFDGKTILSTISEDPLPASTHAFWIWVAQGAQEYYLWNTDESPGVRISFAPLVFPESVPVVAFGSNVYTAKTGIFFESWNHVTITHDSLGANAASRVRIYINGKEVAVTYSTSNRRRSLDRERRAGEPWYIGGNPAAPYASDVHRISHNFIGALDDVRIYDSVFTPAQANALFYWVPLKPTYCNK